MLVDFSLYFWSQYISDLETSDLPPIASRHVYGLSGHRRPPSVLDVFLAVFVSLCPRGQIYSGDPDNEIHLNSSRPTF